MTSIFDDDIYDAAQRLTDIGCTVFPVRGKVPAVRWGRFRTTPPDRHQIRYWFDRCDYFGIGLILGDASQSICVRDFDDATSFDEWRSSHRALAAELPTALTRRGGHVYHRSSTPNTIKLPDGELRGNDHFVVVPPSIHPSGFRYSWIRPLTCLPTLVDPIEAGLLPKPSAEASGQRQGITALGNTIGLPLELAVANAIRATLPRRFGERNDLIFQFARRLKALPDLHGLTGRDVLAHAEEWFRSALPRISTKEWRVTRSAFLSAWPRIIHPWGDGTLTTCLADVDSSLPSPVALRYVNDPVAMRLVGLCERLQLIAGSGPFFISTESCGLFGLKHKMQLQRRLMRLINDDVLERLTIGNSFQRKASTYLYLPTIERTAIQ